ncbi:ubiquinol-cytochrome-c reductase complex assembly factor 2 [Latimeria chalumnae]|uniref:Mitochondrial nucleoid factor 1 n=1 Tax=Latimeria chalumnae TaxID=7897 RepID=H3B9P7_LATCH|nr:PREDICTED: ubiquinol-cytochrome-c reductase complex assembly factor 2 [Latimeria chalumnae]|eukprot:XP_005995524.1 PREDICTED: ubiquinol-cytochrome-c reductase complex assembly factor 2 [Latimeria chalumnae]
MCAGAVSARKMSATRYRRFLRLCEEWPIDETKRGRDLGLFLREKVAQAFREGERTQIADTETCDQMYESLARINYSFYREKFPRFQETSFTGVTVEECRVVLATDSMKQMEEMKKGIWKKLRERFSTKAPEEGAKE